MSGKETNHYFLENWFSNNLLEKQLLSCEGILYFYEDVIEKYSIPVSQCEDSTVILHYADHVAAQIYT